VTSKISSTAGETTTTIRDPTRPYAAPRRLNDGRAVARPGQDQPSVDQSAPASTRLIKEATSAGATSSWGSTAASLANESWSRHEISPWRSMARLDSFVASPSTPVAATRAPEGRRAAAANVSDVLTKSVSDVSRHHSCHGEWGSQK
jgi:hypothetical protein